MNLAEPMTMATDYALAAVTAMLGWRLFRSRENQSSRRHWSGAFGALAVAAALGGSYHGFGPVLTGGARDVLWKLTVLAVGGASYGMAVGSAIAVTEAPARSLLVAFAAAKLALYSAWMLVHDAYLYVVADSAAAMLVVGALHGLSLWRRHDTASRWMLLAVLVSALAAGVQASRVKLFASFNHNDLYHVIQMVGMALFYVGATQLRDRLSTPRGCRE